MFFHSIALDSQDVIVSLAHLVVIALLLPIYVRWLERRRWQETRIIIYKASEARAATFLETLLGIATLTSSRDRSAGSLMSQHVDYLISRDLKSHEHLINTVLLGSPCLTPGMTRELNHIFRASSASQTEMQYLMSVGSSKRLGALAEDAWRHLKSLKSQISSESLRLEIAGKHYSDERSFVDEVTRLASSIESNVLALSRK